MLILRSGVFTNGVGVKVLIGVSVNVAGAIFVLVGRKVGVLVAVEIAGVGDAPMITGVGL